MTERVRFEAAGAGDGFTVRLVRHRQTKGTEQIGFTFGTPRQSSTLPIWTLTSKKSFAGVRQEDAGDLRIANIRLDPNYVQIVAAGDMGKGRVAAETRHG